MIIGKDAKTATLRPEIRLALFVVDTYVYRITGQHPVLTCGTNGKHMVGSRHYKASAIDVDWKPWGQAPESIATVAAACRMALGSDYDVITHSSHLHVEWDPK